jgi:release factor glutamine methyltransferase
MRRLNFKPKSVRMISYGEAIRFGESELKYNRSNTFDLEKESELLLKHSVGKEMFRDEEIEMEDFKKFKKLIQKRNQKMPIQFLIGHCYFYGNKFELIFGDTLIPRPDSETVRKNSPY